MFSWSGNPQTSIDTFIWVGGDAILNQHTFKIVKKNNDLKFPYDDKVIGEFCNILNPVIQMYVKNLLENKKLSYIRDSLLPKLMSGEIRVPIEEVQ